MQLETRSTLVSLQLISSDIPAEGNSWASNRGWWANAIPMAHAITGDGVSETINQIINLKDYTNGSGDIDIWVDVYVSFAHTLDSLAI